MLTQLFLTGNETPIFQALIGGVPQREGPTRAATRAARPPRYRGSSKGVALFSTWNGVVRSTRHIPIHIVCLANGCLQNEELI